MDPDFSLVDKAVSTGEANDRDVLLIMFMFMGIELL